VLVPLALCVLLIFALLPDLRTHNKFSPSQKTTATAGQTPH
jgi:hypothetical protein